MARYVLPIAGAVVGGIFGGPMGAQMGWALGSALGSIVDPQVIKGPSIGDISQQTSQEGVPRPIVIGVSHPIAGNVIATSPPNIVRRRERQGKGGPKVETESVYRTYAIRICEGPVGGVLRVWRDNVLVYDARPNSELSAESNAKFLQNARFFLGTFDQNPSPDLEAVFGVGTTPAHRGTCYMVMANEDLTDRRGSIPVYQFQVATGSDSIQTMVLSVASAAGFSSRIARSEGALTFEQSPNMPGNGNGEPMQAAIDIKYNAVTNRWFVVSMVSQGGTSSDPTRIPIRFSDDDGASWQNPLSSDAATWFEQRNIVIATTQSCVITAGGQNSAQFMYSDDNGNNWKTGVVESQEFGQSENIPEYGMVYANSIAYALSVPASPGGTARLYTSSDGGANWTWANCTGLSGEYLFSLCHGVDRFVAHSATHLWSSENGIHWTQREAFTAGTVCFNPHADPSYFLAVGGEGTLKSFDGETWTNVGAAPLCTGYLFPSERGVIYATRGGPSNGSLSLSDDDGETWQEFDGLPELNVNWRHMAEKFAIVTSLGETTLTSAIEKICDRAGFTSDLRDLSQIDDDVEFYGITVVNTYPAYAALQALSQVYFFAPSYYDGVLHFVPMGANSAATITEDDMVDDHDIEIEESLRDDSIAVPRVMHLMYYDINGGLATDKQTSERAGDHRAVGEQSIQSAVVMSADHAARAISINHKIGIENLRGTLRFCLPDNWIRLAPNDPCIVQWNGLSKRVRLTKVEILDGYQQYEALHDRQSAYASEVEGIPAAPQTPPPSNIIGPTLIEPLDIHILRDADDNAGLIYYVAVSGMSGNWTGATIELSLDGGANYIDALSTTVETIMGSLQAALPDHPQAFPDVVNTLAIEVHTYLAEFDETDLTGMLNGRNRALVGNEIIQFANADETSEGKWELSNLLRGRKGTATQHWLPGTRFILLDTATVGVVPASLVDIGKTLTFRATSFGETSDTATVVSMVYEGKSQTEREPAYVTARLDGSDAIVEWQGVGRLGSGARVAHGIRFAGYRVTLTGANAVVIAVDTNAQSLTQDVSTLTTPIQITVSQLNDLTGEGPAIELILGA